MARVEQFNQSLKSPLYSYMTGRESYIDSLDATVTSYKETAHSRTGFTLNVMSYENQETVADACQQT